MVGVIQYDTVDLEDLKRRLSGLEKRPGMDSEVSCSEPESLALKLRILIHLFGCSITER